MISLNELSASAQAGIGSAGANYEVVRRHVRGQITMTTCSVER
jgi:hypothetical protein